LLDVLYADAELSLSLKIHDYTAIPASLIRWILFYLDINSTKWYINSIGLQTLMIWVNAIIKRSYLQSQEALILSIRWQSIIVEKHYFLSRYGIFLIVRIDPQNPYISLTPKAEYKNDCLKLQSTSNLSLLDTIHLK
jgi:hypothetical protein